MSRMKEDQKQIFYLSGVVQLSAIPALGLYGFCEPQSSQLALQNVFLSSLQTGQGCSSKLSNVLVKVYSCLPVRKRGMLCMPVW